MKKKKQEIPKKEATNKAEDKYDKAKHDNLETIMNFYERSIGNNFMTYEIIIMRKTILMLRIASSKGQF